MPGILPRLTDGEKVQLTRIYSASERAKGTQLFSMTLMAIAGA